MESERRRAGAIRSLPLTDAYPGAANHVERDAAFVREPHGGAVDRPIRDDPTESDIPANVRFRVLRGTPQLVKIPRNRRLHIDAVTSHVTTLRQHTYPGRHPERLVSAMNDRQVARSLARKTHEMLSAV